MSQSADYDAASHRHPWFECEECRQLVSDRMDANLRADLVKSGVPEHDADLLIAQAREEGRRARESRFIPPGETP